MEGVFVTVCTDRRFSEGELEEMCCGKGLQGKEGGGRAREEEGGEGERECCSLIEFDNSILEPHQEAEEDGEGEREGAREVGEVVSEGVGFSFSFAACSAFFF